LSAGSKQDFTASATVAGVQHDVTSGATWSSSDTSNVTITQGVNPVAVNVGTGAKSGDTITITATYGSSSVTATAKITIQ